MTTPPLPRTQSLIRSLIVGRMPSITGSKDTWPKLALSGPVLGLGALLIPGPMLVVSICRVLLRQRPDRMVAARVLVGGLVLAAVLLLLTGSYLPAWSAVAHSILGSIYRGLCRVVPAFGHPGPASGGASRGDVVTVLTWSVLLGLPAGPVWWWLDTRWRERQPMGGADELARRETCEGERTLRTTHRWQSLAHDPRRPEWVRKTAKLRAVPLMDGTNGTLLGRRLAGDLKWRIVRGIVLLPENFFGHIVALGTTGCGKSEFIWLLLKSQMNRKVRADGRSSFSVGLRLLHAKDYLTGSTSAAAQERTEGARMVPRPHHWIYIDCKQHGLGVSPTERLEKMARESGRSFKALKVGVSPWDPMRGTPQRVQQRLMAAQEWSEPWYQDLAAVMLTLSLELARQKGQSPESLAELVSSLLHGGLEQLAGKDKRAAHALAMIQKKDDGGLVTRLMNMATQLAGWIGPVAAGGFSWEDAEVISIALPTGTDPGAARMLLRLMLTDLEGWIVEERRPRIGPRQEMPLTMVLEEVSAVDNDPLLQERIKNSMEMWRAAQVQAVLVAHGPDSLGEPRIRDTVLDSCLVVSGFMRAGEGPENLVRLVGTERAVEASAAYQPGAAGLAGSQRMQHVFKVNPNEIRQLSRGELIFFQGSDYLKVAIAMDSDGYECEAIRQTQIEAGAVSQPAQIEATP